MALVVERERRSALREDGHDYPLHDMWPAVPVLDHGYVQKIESYGSDERIIEAARMSTGKGFLGWEPGPCPVCTDLDYLGKLACLACGGKSTVRGDKFLLEYLWKNKHATPFEMAGMVIEVQAPIEVFRQWQRHRTQSYAEMSARYTALPDVNYMPSVERCLMVNATNKQAGATKGAAELTHESALAWLEELADVYAHAERVYQSGLRRGIAKETARLPVPAGRYSRMRANAVLRNWLAFLTLRSDVVLSGAHAQWEIRQAANVVAEMVKVTYPRTYALFVGEVIS